jgi:hypothetical protein
MHDYLTSTHKGGGRLELERLERRRTLVEEREDRPHLTMDYRKAFGFFVEH